MEELRGCQPQEWQAKVRPGGGQVSEKAGAETDRLVADALAGPGTTPQLPAREEGDGEAKGSDRGQHRQNSPSRLDGSYEARHLQAHGTVCRKTSRSVGKEYYSQFYSKFQQALPTKLADFKTRSLLKEILSFLEQPPSVISKKFQSS